MSLPPRILPAVNDHNQPFWTRGANGELVIQWCETCGNWVHPPAPCCPEGHDALEPRSVSGRGTVFSFTVNRHSFNPGVPVPFVVAIVELAEQEDLRVVTNIVACSPEDVSVGMRVRVAFEQHDDMFVPVFEPE